MFRQDISPRKIVYDTLEFEGPDRIPRQLWWLPWAQQSYPTQFNEIRRRFPDDLIYANGELKEKLHTSGQPYAKGSYTDEWNCTFETPVDGVLGEVREPLIKTWADVEKVRIPRECLSIDIERINTFCRNTKEFVLAGCCPRPFERLQFLRGSENLLLDIATSETDLLKLRDIIHEFYIQEFDLWARTEVDALAFMDDWGMQHSLLISPQSWRELFKPLYRDYISIAHSHGKKVFMHSDGYTLDIIEDLIELGLDAINTQLFCMDIEQLGQRYKGRITFWGELDRQQLLATGSEEQIEQAVKLVHRNLYHNGGLIAQLEFGPGARPENISKAFETWNNFV